MPITLTREQDSRVLACCEICGYRTFQALRDAMRITSPEITDEDILSAFQAGWIRAEKGIPLIPEESEGF